MIKFDDHFIEQGDAVKGGALMVFRRIFSSTMRPGDGFVIDEDGQVPEVYAERHAATGFEKDLWKRFWDLANDEKLASERGVRAIHGDAPYMRLEPDRVYEICPRSTGEVIPVFALAALIGFENSAYAQNAPLRAPDVRYEPSSPEQTKAMLQLAAVTKKDVAYDLGCGDGRLMITAAKEFGAPGVGIDLDSEGVKESIAMLKKRR